MRLCSQLLVLVSVVATVYSLEARLVESTWLSPSSHYQLPCQRVAGQGPLHPTVCPSSTEGGWRGDGRLFGLSSLWALYSQRKKPAQMVLKNKFRFKRPKAMIYSGKLVLQKESNRAGQH